MRPFAGKYGGGAQRPKATAQRDRRVTASRARRFALLSRSRCHRTHARCRQRVPPGSTPVRNRHVSGFTRSRRSAGQPSPARSGLRGAADAPSRKVSGPLRSVRRAKAHGGHERWRAGDHAGRDRAHWPRAPRRSTPRTSGLLACKLSTIGHARRQVSATADRSQGSPVAVIAPCRKRRGTSGCNGRRGPGYRLCFTCA